MGRYGDPPTLRKVLHMKGVTQCAVLQEYRRFLVLADKSLIAYDLEALVPSGQGTLSAAPMRIGSGQPRTSPRTYSEIRPATPSRCATITYADSPVRWRRSRASATPAAAVVPAIGSPYEIALRCGARPA